MRELFTLHTLRYDILVKKAFPLLKVQIAHILNSPAHQDLTAIVILSRRDRDSSQRHNSQHLKLWFWVVMKHRSWDDSEPFLSSRIGSVTYGNSQRQDSCKFSVVVSGSVCCGAVMLTCLIEGQIWGIFELEMVTCVMPNIRTCCPPWSDRRHILTVLLLANDSHPVTSR